MDILATRRKYKKAYRNYLSIMWNVWRGRDKINVILIDGKSYQIEKSFAMLYATLVSLKNSPISNPNLNENGIKFTYNNKNVTINSFDNRNEITSKDFGDIDAVFLKEDYSYLDVNNKTVIDIGANIGDSAIYFALNNAKEVISLEPYPYSYNKAIQNIKNNGFDSKVKLLNAGYGEDGFIKVNPDFQNSTSSNLKSFGSGIKIKVLSLKTLLNDYSIDNAVLKMDCEGCEYNLLKEDNETLKKFSKIQIEYHYGYDKLKKKLEDAGFDVTYTEPRSSYNKDATDHNMELGYIFAKPKE